MRRYEVDIAARKEGAIGQHGTERRTVTVEAKSLDDVNAAAIAATYKLGGLEHVKVIRVKELGLPAADAYHNPNCDGGTCASVIGEVRVYPLGHGGNLILCHACFAHENKARHLKGRHYGRPEEWPQVNWYTAKVYESA